MSTLAAVFFYLSGAYLVIGSITLQTKTFIASLIFKIIPLFIGATLIFYAVIHSGSFVLVKAN